MKSLQELLQPWLSYTTMLCFENLCIDSRQIKTGDLFLAMPGHQVDGRQFITQAINQGAVAIIVHTDNPAEHGHIKLVENITPVISFFELANQVAHLAQRAYPLDTTKLNLAAVTGTNGKTSVTQLMAQLVELTQQRAAILGTVGNGLWGQLQQTDNTTPDATTCAQQLHRFQQQGATFIAMEVSSHGLVQKRINTQPFSLAIFTNLTRDHLDYHGNIQNYALAKKRLFNLPQIKQHLFNIDDPTGAKWYEEFQNKAASYSLNPDKKADYTLHITDTHQNGFSAQLHWQNDQVDVRTPLLGTFNLSNLLAALAGLHLLGHDLRILCEQVQYLRPVTGRMECFKVKQQPMCVVDYAHTPDALEQALKALQQHCQGQLWCIVGCGGERDVGKRPIMAAIAEQHAQKLILTADNPRSESVEAILLHMKQGLKAPEKVEFEPIRQTAIQKALAQAKPQDLILIAGKGHETYQEINGIKNDYNERLFVQDLLKEAS